MPDRPSAALQRTGPLDTSRLDTGNPGVARCYDAMLGGKDNYAVDRAVVDEIRRLSPTAHLAARDNRQWFIRVVRYLAVVAGIDQFLDCGSGLPTDENTHQVVQRANPEAVVVYIDHDPMVHSHGKALLADNDHTHFALADFTRTEELFAHPVVARNIDLSRPVAVLHAASLHHLHDEQDPWGTVARCLGAVASGSYVAVSHLHRPEPGELAAEVAGELEDAALRLLGSGRFRTGAEITALLDGTEIVPPGFVRAADWWPDGPPMHALEPGQNLVLGGLGRKP